MVIKTPVVNNKSPDTSEDSSQTSVDQNRRVLMKSAVALSAVATLPGCGGSGGGGGSSGNQPNILFILVDEMRFPKVFPTGINSAAEYLKAYMPNVYRLWDGGVVFSNHNSASTACSPSRGVLVTGLYSHQTWFGTTLVVKPGAATAESPSLQPEFPTYGKLLSAAGYATPYIGKWHCSQASGPTQELYTYGFQGLTYPDPIANNLQGTYGDMSDPSYYYYSDEYIATQANTWLKAKKVGDQPWCLTVGFQNPHDQEFFPAGTEYQAYTNYFASNVTNPNNYAQNQNWSTAVCATAPLAYPNILVNPPTYAGLPTTAPNWETQAMLESSHPKAHILNKQFCEVEWGGISGNSNATTFSIAQYPNATTASSPTYTYTPPSTSSGQLIGIGYSPYSYWNKALNLYIYIQTILDKQIGRVLDAMSPEVLKNTVIVFTSDHGDYVGAHGFVAGKTLSMYDEALRVPLIVKDMTGTYTGDTTAIRTQLTSSVDLMPMLVGFGYGGQTSWMQGDYREMYGKRYNMFPLLKSSSVAGLDYALFATDEVCASEFDFATVPTADGQRTPVHIMGVITPQYKLGVYSRWPAGTVLPSPNGQQYEYYDYSTTGGQQETANTYSTSPAAKLIKDNLLNVLVPTVLEAPLPLTYRTTQDKAKLGLVAFNLLNQSSGRE